MDHDSFGQLEAVLFFDACMPKIKPCADGCENKVSIMCRHRLGSNIAVLHTTEFDDFLMLYDFQIILRCIFLTTKIKKFRRLAEMGRFFIITKDRKFLRDAETVWNDRRKNGTKPGLAFGHDSVCFDNCRIIVKTIGCKNYGTNRHDDLLCVIRELKKMGL